MDQLNYTLFNFLKKENLVRYVKPMVKEAITFPRLLEFNTEEVNELATVLYMPLGDKHALKRILAYERNRPQSNDSNHNDNRNSNSQLSSNNNSQEEEPKNHEFEDRMNTLVQIGSMGSEFKNEQDCLFRINSIGVDGQKRPR